MCMSHLRTFWTHIPIWSKLGYDYNDCQYGCDVDINTINRGTIKPAFSGIVNSFIQSRIVWESPN